MLNNKLNYIADRKIREIEDDDQLDKKSDSIYYNAVVANNTPGLYIPIEYIDNRVSQILKKPSDYYGAVVRFKVPILALPIMIFKSNYYYVQFSYKGVNYPLVPPTVPFVPQFVPYISDGKSIDGSQNIFTLQEFLDCVNEQMKAIYNQLQLSNPGDPNVPPGPDYVPYIIFDREANLFSLIAPSNMVNVNGNGNGIPPPFKPPNPNIVQIFMNPELSDLFLWQAFGDASPNILPLDSLLIYIKDNYNNQFTKTIPNPFGPIPPTIDQVYYKMTQEQPTTYLFNEFQSIVFLSNSLGLKSELIPAFSLSPNIGYTGNSGGDNTLSLVTDFEPQQDPILDRGYLQYFPTGPYRYMDFDTTEEIRNIKINAYWTDRSLQLHKIYIGPGQIFSMKILFRKKKSAALGNI